MLAGVLPETARHFARAIVMPNLVPPVVTGAEAAAYRDRILAALPEGMDFQPLMTLYLTEETDPDDVAAAQESGLVTAVKLYPAGATTNSASGVTDFDKVRPVLERMAEIGLPLCIHGEVTIARGGYLRPRDGLHRDRARPAARAHPRPQGDAGTHHHGRRRRLCRRGSGRHRRHDHHPSPDDRPQPHPRGRHQAALLLPAGGQAPPPPRRAAPRRHLRQPALFPRHRQRAP